MKQWLEAKPIYKNIGILVMIWQPRKMFEGVVIANKSGIYSGLSCFIMIKIKKGNLGMWADKTSVAFMPLSLYSHRSSLFQPCY